MSACTFLGVFKTTFTEIQAQSQVMTYHSSEPNDCPVS